MKFVSYGLNEILENYSDSIDQIENFEVLYTQVSSLFQDRTYVFEVNIT